MALTRTSPRTTEVTLSDGHPKCYLAQFSPTPCSGALRKVHLIEKQALARRGHDPWMDGSWVWGCGGPWPGLSAHHGELDGFKLVIPPERLPVAVVELAHEIGMVPYLERRYGYERAEDRAVNLTTTQGAPNEHSRRL